MEPTKKSEEKPKILLIDDDISPNLKALAELHCYFKQLALESVGIPADKIDFKIRKVDDANVAIDCSFMPPKPVNRIFIKGFVFNIHKELRIKAKRPKCTPNRRLREIVKQIYGC
jgi:hypothetical protein